MGSGSTDGQWQADVEIPINLPTQREAGKFTAVELPVPIDSVRLIHRLVDPSTGKDRDVVVKLVRGGAPYLQRSENSPLPRHTRYIAGEDIEIPWPKVEAPDYDAWEGDTSRYDVENRTWTPTVYHPPVPTGVFEDLIGPENKYSKSRRWHDDEYVRMKVLEDARSSWYMGRRIEAPVQKLREEQKRRAAARVERIKQAGMSEKTIRIVEMAMNQGPVMTRRKVEALA